MENNRIENVLILWDIDGTLIRNPSRGPKNNVHLDAITSHFEGAREANSTEGMTDRQVLRIILEENHIEITPKLIDDLCQTLDSLSHAKTYSDLEIFTDSLECLEYFRELGFSQGIQTGNSKHRTFLKLKETNLLDFLDKNYIFSGEAIESREFLLDSHAQMLANFRKVILIGDSDLDCLLALRSNLCAVIRSQKISRVDEYELNPDFFIVDKFEPAEIIFRFSLLD